MSSGWIIRRIGTAEARRLSRLFERPSGPIHFFFNATAVSVR